MHSIDEKRENVHKRLALRLLKNAALEEVSDVKTDELLKDAELAINERLPSYLARSTIHQLKNGEPTQPAVAFFTLITVSVLCLAEQYKSLVTLTVIFFLVLLFVRLSTNSKSVKEHRNELRQAVLCSGKFDHLFSVGAQTVDAALRKTVLRLRTRYVGDGSELQSIRDHLELKLLELQGDTDTKQPPMRGRPDVQQLESVMREVDKTMQFVAARLDSLESQLPTLQSPLTNHFRIASRAQEHPCPAELTAVCQQLERITAAFHTFETHCGLASGNWIYRNENTFQVCQAAQTALAVLRNELEDEHVRIIAETETTTAPQTDDLECEGCRQDEEERLRRAAGHRSH